MDTAVFAVLDSVLIASLYTNSGLSIWHVIAANFVGIILGFIIFQWLWRR